MPKSQLKPSINYFTANNSHMQQKKLLGKPCLPEKAKPFYIGHIWWWAWQGTKNMLTHFPHNGPKQARRKKAPG